MDLFRFDALGGTISRVCCTSDLNSRTLKGHRDQIRSAVFGPDGTKIVSASVDKTVKIWDVENGECLRTLKGHRDWICSAVFSPDGTKIVSASRDKTVKIWNVKFLCINFLQRKRDTQEKTEYLKEQICRATTIIGDSARFGIVCNDPLSFVDKKKLFVSKMLLNNL